MTAIPKLLISACLFVLTSCKKQDNGGHGNILITGKHNGNIVYPAIFYIKYGSNPDPTNYDDMQVGDPYGQAYFKRLNSGTYFLRATGYDGSTHSAVSGEATINIGPQVRTNEKTVILELR